MPTKFIKKIGTLFFLISTILNFSNYTQAKDYEYTNLDITANVLIDGTINVKEDFTTNFFVNKHGIIRTIPLNYTVEGHNFHIDVSDIYVKGKNFSTNKSNGEIEIKIGDANHTVIGNQNYPISYSTYGLIRNFSGMGYAELYWNLVGYDFDTNINKVHAEIILPKIYTGFTTGDFLITTNGTTTSVDQFLGTVDWSQGNKIIINYDKSLPAYQGITLAIKFPNNYFQFDHKKQKNLTNHKFLLPNIYHIIYLVLVIITSINYIINKYIKGGKLTGAFAKEFPIIIQYDPPKGLNSAEVGLLLHRKATVKDMISLIYKRASEGLINISIETKKSFLNKKNTVILTKNKEIPPENPNYEKILFKSLINSGKNKLEQSTNLHDKLTLSELENYGEKEGRFYNRKSDKGKIAIFILIIVTFIFMSMENTIRIGIVSLLFAITIRSFLGGNKLQETKKGAQLISHILGYKEFLHTCDENKLRLFLQQDPLYFDKILPYAIVFGLETELLKKLEPIFKEMNKESSTYGDINSIHTINNIISSSARHSLTSPSYSSSSGFSSGSSFGGGFSHGGGGGGGGGRSR